MTTSLPLVEVFILSYNRSEYILQTIDSVLGQTYPRLKIIVSDNSSRDEVEQKIQSYADKDKVTYLRRRPTLPALTHFNTIFAEATSEYFMVFHDDDVMLPDAVSKLVSAIEKDPRLAAVGGNALVLEEDRFTKNLFDPMLTEDRTLTRCEELADHYLDSSKGHVPFPSYLYRRAKIANLKMIFKEGQKHADVSFYLKPANKVLYCGSKALSCTIGATC
ncbi:MAG: glycosyltransferase family 2 protein [Bdellovibrionaceae bacterium]|nr:glycosyltransferase family 2 protein [Pseudobdellovibrionaceae bacterium]